MPRDHSLKTASSEQSPPSVDAAQQASLITGHRSHAQVDFPMIRGPISLCENGAECGIGIETAHATNALRLYERTEPDSDKKETVWTSRRPPTASGVKVVL